MFYCETCFKSEYPYEDLDWEYADENPNFYVSRGCQSCKIPAICVDDSFIDEDNDSDYEDPENCDCESCLDARGELYVQM